jgi:hypothetical protein
MTDDRSNFELLKVIAEDVQYLRQQVVDTRCDVLTNREMINELANDSICALGEIKTEIDELKAPLNNRLALATTLSVLAAGLAIACFIQL